MNIRQLVQPLAGWGGTATAMANIVLQYTVAQTGIGYAKMFTTAVSAVALGCLSTLPNPGNVRERIANAKRLYPFSDSAPTTKTMAAACSIQQLSPPLMETQQQKRVSQEKPFNLYKLPVGIAVTCTAAAITTIALELVSSPHEGVVILAFTTALGAGICAFTKIKGDLRMYEAMNAMKRQYAANKTDFIHLLPSEIQAQTATETAVEKASTLEATLQCIELGKAINEAHRIATAPSSAGRSATPNTANTSQTGTPNSVIRSMTFELSDDGVPV